MRRKRSFPRAVRSAGIFLQARLGSTRLREKVLLPLAGRTVIEHAMLALRPIDAVHHLLLVDHESAGRLRPYAERCGFELFAGSSTDVLARYAAAVEAFPVDYVVRATADNPLVSGVLVEQLLDLHVAYLADFSGFVDMPLGLGVEIVNRTALLTEDRESVDPYEREHVNPFLYRRPDRFSILRPRVAPEYRLMNCSVTLDTHEDYRYLERIFGELYREQPLDTVELVEWLRNHPRDPERGEGRTGSKSALHSVG